jgi:hypothetical protein
MWAVILLASKEAVPLARVLWRLASRVIPYRVAQLDRAEHSSIRPLESREQPKEKSDNPRNHGRDDKVPV